MLRKNCRVCGKASYSASEHRSWLCPYCNTDLAKEKTMDVNSIELAQADEQSLAKLGLKNKSTRGKT
ncbi:hypothetical protein [Desulfosporosinus sp. Sb-LF]|uniref:hypothetical protein n=1 Tax=Desulfosporosinus sp. Sb-LF TaxID=2560027 RepID=UPI00107F1C78|nr:hypothetical protein [Desulfosporosinus sp. Sb-LF]TGE31466.1 hypothetical protein E4K68_17215 [Desulfosporosinus sp. Sb-LF]